MEDYTLQVYKSVRAAAMASIRTDRKKAKNAFVERFGRRVFDREITPLWQTQGLRGLFLVAEPNNFLRAFVETLAYIVDTRIAFRETENEKDRGEYLEREAQKMIAEMDKELSRLIQARDIVDDPGNPNTLRKVISRDDPEELVRLRDDRGEDAANSQN